MNETGSTVVFVPKFHALRRFLYAVTHQESSYPPNVKVPNYLDEVKNRGNLKRSLIVATPWFIILMGLEILVLHAKDKAHMVNFSDSMTSVGAGLLQQTVKMIHKRLFIRSVELSAYIWIYENYRVVDLPWQGFATWLISGLAVDFSYYWFHRMAHEVAIFWAIHQFHHSSEYYNLSTALRQSMFQQYTSYVFYLPFALIVPPNAFVVHSYMNLLYQFWIHTQALDTLIWPIEYLFNTPSHHRVHHGRNPYCLDKNYGGTLIVWDRLFGTFEPERKIEKPEYGLVEPTNTFRMFQLQVFMIKDLLASAFNHKAYSSISKKVKRLCYSISWKPGMARVPDAAARETTRKTVQRQTPSVPFGLKLYTLVHLGIAILFYSFLSQSLVNASLMEFILVTVFLTCTIESHSLLYDSERRFSALCVELARCILLLVVSLWFSSRWLYIFPVWIPSVAYLMYEMSKNI